jgi:uncharacterized protein involved in exopolysaccharide biosynthesis
MTLQRAQAVPMQQLGPGEGAPAAPPAQASYAPSGSSEQPFFRLDILRSLQLHRRLAMGFAVAGLVLAVAYTAMKWPVYTAVSQVYIQPQPPKMMDQNNSSRWPNDSNTYDSYIEQQLQNASHPEVLLDALHKLKPGTFQTADENDAAAAYRLGQSVQVARLGTSYEIAITAQTKDPELSADMANALAAAIVDRSSREEKAGDTERLAILREEKDRIQKELDSDRTEQATLNAKLGVASIGATTPDHYDDDISKIHEQLVLARAARDEAAAKLFAVGGDHDLSSKALDAEADELIAADPGLVSMKTSLNQQRAVLITQMANLTPNHPQYKQDAEELAHINNSLDSMTKDLSAKASARIQQRLRTALDQTAGVEGRLNAQLGQLAGAAASATPRMQRASDLATDIVRLQNRNAAIDEQLHNLMLEDSVPGAAHLSATAVAPTHPAVGGILRKALPMALGGILLGLLAALLANNLDTKVYIASDIEHLLGFAPMAQLPDFNQVSDGVAEEHLLRLSSAIEHARQQGDLKSCIFTGIGPGAGATTVATRVRTILESMGRPCVLVDATGTTTPAPRANSAGLGLQSNTSLMPTDRGSRSTALLQQLSSQGKEEEESLILTDTAPLTISAETEYLARYVDAAIVVVESGVTTRAQLREAADTLQRLNVSAVGIVLNRVGLSTADPAFRDSVRAVEKHLRTQSRSFSKRTEKAEKSWAPEPPVSPQPEQFLAQEAAPAHFQFPTIAEAVTHIPVPESRARHASPLMPDLAVSSLEPFAFKPRANQPVSSLEPISAEPPVPDKPHAEHVKQPAPNPASAAAPSLLALQKADFARSEAPRPPDPAQPARSIEPLTADAPPAKPIERPAAPRPIRSLEPLTADAPPARPIEPPAAARPIRSLEPLTADAPPARPVEPPAAARSNRSLEPLTADAPPARPIEPPAAARPARSLEPLTADAPPARPIEPPAAARSNRSLEPLTADAPPAKPIQPPAAARPAKSIEPLTAGAPPARPVEPPAAARPAKSIEPLTADAPPQPAVEAPKPGPKKPWAQSWERIPTKLDVVKPEPAIAEATEPEETPFTAATRIGGLRNLVFSLGLNDPQKETEARPQALQVPPPVEPARGRPAYTHAYAPPAHTHVPTPVSKEAASVSKQRVTAPPEFLPPKIEVESADKEQSKASQAAARQDRRDSFDDVEILPSWHGQYRKR